MGDEPAPAKVKHICFVCKRKFKNVEQLARHEEQSLLHKGNLERQEQTLAHQKQQLYQSLSISRKQLYALNQATEKDACQDEAFSREKQQVEDRLTQVEATYGLVQEKIEARRRSLDQARPTLAGQTFELTPGWTVQGTAMGWWGNKDVQEDRFLLDMVLAGGDALAYAVMDGHTGSKCVDFVHASLPRSLERCFSSKPKPLSEDSIKQGIKEALCLVEDEFLTLAKAHDLVDGTTINMVVFFADKSDVNLDGSTQVRRKVICANVGDTRSVVSRPHQRSGVEALSEDHKPTRPSEKRRIEECGGAVTEVNGIGRVFTLGSVNIHGRMMHLGLSVARSLGDLPLKEPVPLVDARPEFQTVELGPDDDCVLVACDGVWDYVSNREGIFVARDADARTNEAGSEESRLNAAVRVVRRAFEKGSNDNLTAVTIFSDCTNPNPVAAPTKRRRL